jgi:anti-sigma regulatory factor (Ser/Thr protein kinase)
MLVPLAGNTPGDGPGRARARSGALRQECSRTRTVRRPGRHVHATHARPAGFQNGRRGGGYGLTWAGGLSLEPRTELRLPAESIAPALARAGLRSVTADLPDRVAADAALLTTEVVSNAVIHASTRPGDEVTVRIYSDHTVRVEVVDCGELFEPPNPRQPWDMRPTGWGLFLVDSVADAWGIEEEANGKMVWFELDPSDG